MALKSIGGFFSSLASRVRGIFSGGLDRVGQAQVSLTMRGVRRLLNNPQSPSQNPSPDQASEGQQPNRSFKIGSTIPDSPPTTDPDPEVITEAFHPAQPPPTPGAEPGPEPSPEPGPTPGPTPEPKPSGGIPVSDAIRRSAGLIRAVFGRDIPDKVYAAISLDPELPIAILTAIGCENEPIDFLTNLSAKAKHRVAIGAFGVFLAADIVKLMLARRELADQIKASQQRRSDSQPQREADLRSEVNRQASE